MTGVNGSDDVIIVVACISDLHIIYVYGLRGGADAEFEPSTIPLPRYDNVRLLSATLLVTVCLIEVVEYHHLEDAALSQIKGLWKEGIISSGVLVGTEESSASSLLSPRSDFVDNR